MPRIGSKQLNSTMSEYVSMCAIASKGESSIYNELAQEDKQKFERRISKLVRSHWQILPTSEHLEIGDEEKYFGVAFYKFHHRERVIEIVIAHRGTVLNTKNILNDIAIVNGWSEEHSDEFPPKIAEYAATYFNQLFAGHDFFSNASEPVFFGNDRNYQLEIIHVGFSLGGYLAGYCACRSQFKHVYALAIDGPGISDCAILFSHPDREDHIVNYLTKPNMVNTCKKQVGEIRQLESFIQNENDSNVKLDIKINFHKSTSIEELFILFPSFYQAFNDTLDTHNLEKIIANDLLSYRVVTQWPIAVNKIIYQHCPNLQDDSLTNIIHSLFGAAFWTCSSLLIGRGISGLIHKRDNIVTYQFLQPNQYKKRPADDSVAVEDKRPEKKATVTNIFQFFNVAADQDSKESSAGITAVNEIIVLDSDSERDNVINSL